MTDMKKLADRRMRVAGAGLAVKRLAVITDRSIVKLNREFDVADMGINDWAVQAHLAVDRLIAAAKKPDGPEAIGEMGMLAAISCFLLDLTAQPYLDAIMGEIGQEFPVKQT